MAVPLLALLANTIRAGLTALRTKIAKAWFKKLVKQAFQQRRKKLSNALKGLILLHPEKEEISSMSYFSKRAEALSVEDFIKLTNLLL